MRLCLFSNYFHSLRMLVYDTFNTIACCALLSNLDKGFPQNKATSC
jgi:hypothetical protein